MPILYVFGAAFGLPDPSPFVTKAHILLKMTGLSYKTAPADFKKEGSCYDLPIALAILGLSGDLAAESVKNWLILGQMAERAVLRGQPNGKERCDNCLYYLDPTNSLSYCWHPQLRILVGDEWWCQWWEKIEE